MPIGESIDFVAGPSSTGTISDITSTNGSIIVTNPTGPTVDLAVNPSVEGMQATPTTMTMNFTIPANSQVLFRQPIIMGSFQIIAGADSALIGV
jgi:hypothetical protein